jgi:HK97 family phage portal protein
MKPGAVLKHPASLNAPSYKELRNRLKEKYSGLGQSWDFMLLDEGMDITFPQIKLVDAQFLENEKFTQAQIAGLFRVPLMLIQAGDAPTTYASSEQFMLAFVTHALTPIVVNIEKAIYRDLLTEEEKNSYYAKFNMAGLLRGDMKSSFEAWQIGI